MTPTWSTLRALLAEHAGPGARVLTLDEEDPLAQLAASEGPWDAILAARPTQRAPLLPLLACAREALTPQGALLVADLVWQTAPTAELLRAFAPEPGRDKVRPIEGYEMQMDHAGFEIVARGEVARAHWTPRLPDAQRSAVDADTRGAAKLATWALRRAPD